MSSAAPTSATLGVEEEPSRRGWNRLGEPFAHALDGSPVKWTIAVVSGLALAVLAMQVPGAFTGETSSSWFTNVAWAAVLAVLPLLTQVDAAIRMLPNRIIYPAGGLALTFLVADAAFGDLPVTALLRGVVVSVAFVVVFVAVILVAPPGGFGLGDVRLLALGGLVLGTHSVWLPVAALVIAPPLFALLPAIAVLVTSKDKDAGLAFGPFICLGILVGAFAQPALTALSPMSA